MDDATPLGADLDRRKVLLGLMLAAGSGITFARQPRTPINYLGAAKLDKLIPKQFGRWDFATTSGLVVPPEDPLSDSLYSQLLTRVYQDGSSAPIMLLVAQSAGQTGVLQVHRPEFCYPASGYELSPIVPRALQVNGRPFVANELTASQPGRLEQILYWTRVGHDMPESWAKQRLSIAMANLKGDIPDAVLVRISTVDPDRTGAVQRLSAFVEAMVSAMPAASRRVLISGV